MTVKYKTVITKAGAIKLAAATVPNGKKVNFTAMAIGDGGGTLPVPDPNQTKLVKEVWRHALNKISHDKKNKNYVVAELLIPPETGGFWMREMGLYDDTGTLIAVGNMAESYKPALAEGSGRAQTVRMVIMVSDIESVELTIDTSTVMATQDYVDDKIAEHEQSRRHPDATLTAKGFTQLSNATDSVSESVAATPKAVKAAYDLAKVKYTAQDATTAQKGIVQLSSATDSTSESLAATPKAVKAAYDLAKGKYTAQDATTTQKGIVQLSSATDSTSESLAATPKAVSTAVKTLKDTLGTAAVKDIVTSYDDTTAGRIPNVGWQGLGGASQYRMGQVSQFLAYAAADLKEVPSNGAGWQSAYGKSRRAQIFMDTTGKVYSRFSLSDVALDTNTPWAVHYTTLNKPTADDVDAVSASRGGTFQKSIIVKGNGASLTVQPLVAEQASYILGKGYNGGNTWYVGRGGANNNVSLYNYTGLNGVVLSEDGTIAINPAQGRPLRLGTVGSAILNIGDSDSGLRNSVDGQIDLLANSKFMGYWNTTIFSFTGQIIPTNYANFDSRYYTKAQSDAGYMPKTSAYTKGESDGRFQPKGSYGAPNSASKAANGWWQCGSTGIIEQWCQGATMTSEATQTITFPKAFPSACLHVEVGTLNVNNSNDTEGMFQLISKSNTGCVVRANRAYGSVGQVAALIKAVGY
ncbi:phage tail-collar fiber domain-containing protein [Enterobacter sichuanensis]|uniref:phage tail-collar fiber domain-containing protein n=1 Tax=Enterobacter sichuanensis TaxID=2071710 RepID=UPI003F1E37A3